MSASPGRVDRRPLLRAIFDAAIAAAQPALCLPCRLSPRPEGDAPSSTARALEHHWGGPLKGRVVTRYGYEVPRQRIEIVQAAHPLPDAAGLRAAERVRGLMTGLTLDDRVTALISGAACRERGHGSRWREASEGRRVRTLSGNDQMSTKASRRHTELALTDETDGRDPEESLARMRAILAGDPALRTKPLGASH